MGFVADEGRHRSADIAFRRFHLDHVGAEIAKYFRAERAGETLAQIEHF
jgi:hypothetical protein